MIIASWLWYYANGLQWDIITNSVVRNHAIEEIEFYISYYKEVLKKCGRFQTFGSLVSVLSF
jgi:hypothetical protein